MCTKTIYKISFTINNVNYDIHILNKETIFIFINNDYSMNITIDKRFIIVEAHKLDIRKLYEYVKQCIKTQYDSYYLKEFVELFFVLNKLIEKGEYKLKYKELEY